MKRAIPLANKLLYTKAIFNLFVELNTNLFFSSFIDCFCLFGSFLTLVLFSIFIKSIVFFKFPCF